MQIRTEHHDACPNFRNDLYAETRTQRLWYSAQFQMHLSKSDKSTISIYLSDKKHGTYITRCTLKYNITTTKHRLREIGASLYDNKQSNEWEFGNHETRFSITERVDFIFSLFNCHTRSWFSSDIYLPDRLQQMFALPITDRHNWLTDQVWIFRLFLKLTLKFHSELFLKFRRNVAPRLGVDDSTTSLRYGSSYS